MKTALLVVALLLAGAHFFAGKSSAKIRQGSAGLLIVVLAILLVQTVLSSRPEKIDYLRFFDEALAVALAQTAANDLAEGAEVAVLLPQVDDADERARFFVDSVRRSLGEVFEKTGITFQECTSTNRPVGVTYMPPSYSAFRDVRKEFPDADALISFIGLPRVPPRACNGFPPMYAMELENGPELQEWLKSGLVGGAVVVKPDYDPAARPHKSYDLTEIFDLRYTLLKP